MSMTWMLPRSVVTIAAELKNSRTQELKLMSTQSDDQTATDGRDIKRVRVRVRSRGRWGRDQRGGAEKRKTVSKSVGRSRWLLTGPQPTSPPDHRRPFARLMARVYFHLWSLAPPCGLLHRWLLLDAALLHCHRPSRGCNRTGALGPWIVEWLQIGR